MKVLLAEFTVFSDPSLSDEGAAMLGAMKTSFEAGGHGVLTPGCGDFESEIRRIGPLCDAGLVIAPDHLLAGFTRALEQVTWNIGCNSLNIAVCASKTLTSSILASHGIDVPAETREGVKVIKPVNGCGSKQVRLSTGQPGPGEIGQEFIEGEPISVSLVGSRICGDVCEFYSGKPPLVLAVNRQRISISNDGTIHYQGGETPLSNHPRIEEIMAIARKTVTFLGCQGYSGVDMVVGERIVVVDVNPRITTSVTGITRTMTENLGDILLEASYGRGPDTVHHIGRVVFDQKGGLIQE
jgi:tyramine---L-glutamate ligase